MSSTEAAAIAGVDVGGGGVRVCVTVGSSYAEGEDIAPIPRDRGHVDVNQLMVRIGSILERASQKLEISRFASVAIGMSGIPGLVKDPGELARMLRGAVEVGSTIVAGDALTTHAGALDSRAGTVIAAGTGVIALGTDLDQIWNKADGWGILLGDEGGGAWIGMLGVKAALRASEGRPNGSFALLDRMTDRFGNVLDVVELIYDAESPAHHFASFAPAVADAARLGDPIAAEIWGDAAIHLAHTAVAAAEGLEPIFSWGGHLFDAGDLILAPFQAEVKRCLPTAQFATPLGTSIDGALSLARRRAADILSTREPYLYVFDS